MLIIIWLVSVLFFGTLEKIDVFGYFLFSGAMLYVTLLSNLSTPTRLSLKYVLFFSNISFSLIWYVAFVYNDFLSLNPIPNETFLGIALIYTYFVLYLSFEPQLTFLPY